jgi:hypothetical protein
MLSPSYQLDFTSAVLDPGITFTRSGTTATRVNASGYIESVAVDTPRFDFNPVTLSCKGLLIEQARSNIRSYSEDFSNATWAPTNLNQTGTPAWVNVENSPANTLTAEKFIPTVTSGIHRVVGGAQGTTSGQRYAMSVFAKKGEYTKVAIGEFNNAVGWGTFDLDAGTVITSGGSGSQVAYISPYKDGWYRCEVVFTAAAFSRFDIYVLNNSYTSGDPNNPGNQFAGNGSDGLFVWGAQLELGDGATSYIANLATGSTTRNPDIATITGANFSSFWQAVTGGASVLATPSSVSGIRPLVQFDDNTASEIIALRGNTTNPELYIVDGGTPQAQIDTGTIAANTAYSLTGWWQQNNSFAQLNTQTSVRDNTVTIPTVTQARIGSDGTNYVNGTIAAIYYYDELANSIYDSLRLLGYTGTVTDMLLQYYLARGATSNSLTDAEIEFLGVKGFTTGTIDDRWTNYLISLGYSGTITDMKYQYWKSPE